MPVPARVRTLVGVLGLALAATGVVAAVPASAAEVVPATVTRESDGGAWLGSDSPFITPKDQITVTGSLARLEVVASHPGSTQATTFVLAPPPGQAALIPGTYRAVDAPGPGSDRATLALTASGRTCARSQGGFTVLEATDLNNLRITYEVRCEDEDAGTSGEIRIGASATDPALLVTPGTLRFPQRSQSDRGQAYAYLVNTGTKDLQIADHEITAGADEFFIQGQDCRRTIEPGRYCDLAIIFDLKGVGERTGELTVTDVSGEVVRKVPLVSTGLPGYGFWGSFGEGEHPVAAGNFEVRPSQAKLTAGGTVNGITASWTFADRFTTLTFGLSPGQGRALASGVSVTDSVGKGAPATEPKITIARANHVGDYPGDKCLDGIGKATLHQLEFDAGGMLSKLSLTYEQRCVAGGDRLFGSIAWHSDSPERPTPGLKGSPPPALKKLTALTDYDSVSLNWGYPFTAPDVDHVEVRQARGATPPASLAQGTAVPVDAQNGVTIENLDISGVYSYSAFLVDTEGLVSHPVSVTVSGTVLTLGVKASKVTYGSPATFQGTVLDARNRAPRVGSEIQILADRPDDQDLVLVADARTDSKGRFTADFVPKKTDEYFVIFLGDGEHLGGAAGFTKVSVAMNVAARAEKAAVAKGKKIVLLTKVTPLGSNKKVLIQELVRGKWKTVATKAVAKGTNKLAVKAAKKGTHTYRVYSAGDAGRVAGKSKTVKVKVT